MMDRRRVRRLGMAGFLSICGLCLSRPAFAQPGLNTTGASNCTEDAFDTRVQFVNGPGDGFAVVVDKRDISSHSCVFDGPMYGPTFVPDRAPDHPPFGLCYYCQDGLAKGQSPAAPPLSLNPGQVARQVFRWKTMPPNETVACFEPKWMSGPILAVTPSLLKRVCSDVEVSGFSLAPSPDDERKPAFELASEKGRYYEGERFYVRVSGIQAGAGAAGNEESCPTLYLRERSPDGTTRIDEVQPLAFKGCPRAILGHRVGDWQSGFELDSGAGGRWAGFGEHTIEVFQLTGSPENGPLRFASSNILRFQLADPSAMPRKWGPRVKGVAADITLDKDTFRIGEDVALHMAVANLDAEVPVYSWDALWDPCSVVTIEVRDASGSSLPASERLPNWSICSGHGFGPRPYAKGKVVPLERSLGAEGWLPNHAGTYTITVTWSPCTGPKPNGSGFGTIASADLKPYAVVHAEATIHIVDPKSGY
jgi:hypothetical protein